MIGDSCRGGIGSGAGDEDEGEGGGVVRRGAFRKMCKCMGSSPANTAGGSGPRSEIAYSTSLLRVRRDLLSRRQMCRYSDLLMRSSLT